MKKFITFTLNHSAWEEATVNSRKSQGQELALWMAAEMIAPLLWKQEPIHLGNREIKDRTDAINVTDADIHSAKRFLTRIKLIKCVKPARRDVSPALYAINQDFFSSIESDWNPDSREVPKIASKITDSRKLYYACLTLFSTVTEGYLFWMGLKQKVYAQGHSRATFRLMKAEALNSHFFTERTCECCDTDHLFLSKWAATAFSGDCS